MNYADYGLNYIEKHITSAIRKNYGKVDESLVKKDANAIWIKIVDNHKNSGAITYDEIHAQLKHYNLYAEEEDINLAGQKPKKNSI